MSHKGGPNKQWIRNRVQKSAFTFTFTFAFWLGATFLGCGECRDNLHATILWIAHAGIGIRFGSWFSFGRLCLTFAIYLDAFGIYALFRGKEISHGGRPRHSELLIVCFISDGVRISGTDHGCAGLGRKALA